MDVCSDVALGYALEYARRGWHVLWLARDDSEGKIPPANCSACSFRSGAPYHDPASCEHLLCHGFHAASGDPARVRAARQLIPRGHLAIRTGRASKLLVLDFESYVLGDDPNENAVDAWETLTVTEPLPPTVRARTVSGGLHLYYRLPWEWEGVVASRRVLNGVDVKCESGYVGAPDGSGRRAWMSQFTQLLDAPWSLLDWLTRPAEGASGGAGGRTGAPSSAGRPPGYDYAAFLKNGCPGGMRDWFFNDLVFRLVKRGTDESEIWTRVHREWSRAAQPPDADWPMPWDHVAYKVKRALAQITPDVDDTQRVWARQQGKKMSRHGVARITMVNDAKAEDS